MIFFVLGAGIGFFSCNTMFINSCLLRFCSCSVFCGLSFKYIMLLFNFIQFTELFLFLNFADINKHFISIHLIKFIYKIIFFQSIVNIFFHNRFFIFFVFLLVL